MKRAELLAPAGSLDKAKIAFMYGADAVYAGTSKLSLRTRAEMNQDDLEETIKYAHSIGKKVYVAMNIYAHDDDYEEIRKEIKRIDSLKADAIIVSDGGILNIVKEIAPNLEIHISTQANNVSLEGAKFWMQNGAKRIILARELPKEKIEYIMKNKPEDLEMEMFIHGAICFASSGRCYLSQYLSDRGANTGDCSQPCRWGYKVTAEEINTPGSIINIDYDEKGTYLFSSKDLCLINQIPAILEMGVESLKIEGRLKTDYYLATIVRSYRQAIDDYYENKGNWIGDKYLSEIEKVKTRGLSEFYFSNSNNQDIHDYSGQSDNMNYEYGAKVLEKDNDTDIVLVEIKNKLTVGDKLEVIDPNSLGNYKYTIDKLYSADNNEEIETVNPGKKGQQVKMKIPYDVKPGYIIRREK